VILPVVEIVLESNDEVDVVLVVIEAALTILALTVAVLIVAVLTAVKMLAFPATKLPVACIVSPLNIPFDVTLPGIIFPVEEMLPVTVKVTSAPTLVILGCAAVVTTPAVFAKTALEILPTMVPKIFPPDMLPVTDKLPPEIFPTTAKLAPAMFPTTARLFNAPTLVILGWAEDVTVPAVLEKALTLEKLASSSLSGILPVLLAKV
jgi:hypothetical protein